MVLDAPPVIDVPPLLTVGPVQEVLALLVERGAPGTRPPQPRDRTTQALSGL